MKKRDLSKPTRKSVRLQQQDSDRLRTYSLMVVCGLTLVSGFFFAGRQHFSSMDYGMKNSRLRRQVDELEAEKRRLLLAREISLSPAEIKKAIKRSGISDPASGGGQLAQVASATKEKAIPATAGTKKPMVVKTASVTAVEPRVNAVFSKMVKVDRPSKGSTSAR